MPINEKWIREGINSEAIDWANNFGKKLTEDENNRKALTTSQIRKFYGELKRIQTDFQKYQSDIPMLRAKLAYAVGRSTNKAGGGGIKYDSKIKDFFDELSPALRLVEKNDKQQFINFVKIVEAVVAYHKFYGGK